MERPSEGSLVLGVAMAASLTAVAASDDVPPRQKRALLEWLTAGSYRERFVAEPEVHSSVAEGQAHGRNVRTYYNPILADDLRAGCHRSGVDFLRSAFRP
jgi:hypothetical protein